MNGKSKRQNGKFHQVFCRLDTRPLQTCERMRHIVLIIVSFKKIEKVERASNTDQEEGCSSPIFTLVNIYASPSLDTPASCTILSKGTITFISRIVFVNPRRHLTILWLTSQQGAFAVGVILPHKTHTRVLHHNHSALIHQQQSQTLHFQCHLDHSGLAC